MALPKQDKVVKHFNRTRKSKIHDDDNFHLIIAPVIAVSQFFGLFPVMGIFARNIENVRFKWLSSRAVHSLIWIAGAFVFLYLEVAQLKRIQTLDAKSMTGIIFFATGVSGGIFFFKLAQQWAEILKAFEKVENIFQSEIYENNSSGWSLKRRIRVTSAVFLVLALSEHLAAWSSFLYDRLIQIKLCKWQIGSMFYYLATTHLHHVYAELPVKLMTVAWAEYMNVSLTFVWSYIDLFIIIVSIGVSSKFHKINKRLECFRERIVNENFWDEIRRHYNEVCELQEFLDERIGNLICLACLNDLYYVCLQLLNVATDFPFPINAFYFWYSLIFLIVRTSGLFFVASSIHDESKLPLKVLRTIPNEGWFNETQRFSQQVQNNCVALSGKKFFFITRGIIITIAGTIVTYELVLLQFDADKIVPGMKNPCPTSNGVGSDYISNNETET